MIFIKRIKKIYKPKLIQLVLRFKRYKVSESILIFSEARGGSTWLMELLSHLPGVVINWEPLHVNNGVVPKPYRLGWRPNIQVGTNHLQYRDLFYKIFSLRLYSGWTTRYISWRGLRQSRYVLTKFVRANLCLPWVVHTFPELKHRPIFLLRHPITTCMSRLKTFERVSSADLKYLKHDSVFEIPDCINNERYITHKDYINGLETKLEVEIAIWCINNASIIVHENSSSWYTLFYEDLVLEPEATFRKLLQGCHIYMSDAVIGNIDFRKPSQSNYLGDFKHSPKEQLESFLSKFTQTELERIQAIFEYFGVHVYSVFSAYPVKT